MMKLFKPRAAEPDSTLSYKESKRLARDDDPAVRVRLAGREDIRPEILYFMAEDDSAEVRGRIAANVSTPRQADLILARDHDQAVREKLARKIEVLLPELDADAQAQAHKYLVEVIEILAQDQVTRMRQIVAEALKEVASAPSHVIQRLARDAEEVVACPVLEFSPLLSDRDLLEIIEGGSNSGRLRAISRRRGVGEQVTDAIVAARDEGAISALLDNASAQIREETLDGLVEAAVEVSAWQEPLVRRPQLPASAARKLDLLKARDDLDRETASLVAREVERRIADEALAAAKEGAVTCGADGGTAEKRAKRMYEAGGLDDQVLTRALNGGDRDLVRHGLALRAELPLSLIDHVLSAHSAKGVTALAWKAGCAMRFACLEGRLRHALRLPAATAPRRHRAQPGAQPARRHRLPAQRRRDGLAARLLPEPGGIKRKSGKVRRLTRGGSGCRCRGR
jgi:uncharacterized protein (DUF2336 family)